jgi:hypothetical protein
MKTTIAAACLLACAFSLEAQLTPTLKRLRNGLDEVAVRNDSAAAVVALAISVTRAPGSGYPNAPLVIFSGPLIDPAAQPLAAGEKRVGIAMGGPVAGPLRIRAHVLEEPVAAAGILADGTTTGDAALLTRLMVRRSNMLQAVEMAIETLADAGKHNVPRGQLIGEFKRLADSLNHWYLPPEQHAGGHLYESIAGELLSLPEGPPGSPFPPDAFVEQETAALRRQRLTLLESRPSLADAAVAGR